MSRLLAWIEGILLLVISGCGDPLVDGQYQGPETLTAYQGDTVQLDVFSDQDDAMHVHGYEKHLVLPSGATAVLRFTAENSGRFMLELHGSDLQFGSLEVYPRR